MSKPSLLVASVVGGRAMFREFESSPACVTCKPMSPEDVHTRRDHEHGQRGAVSYCTRCTCQHYRPQRWWRWWHPRRPAQPPLGAAGCADPDPPQGGLRS